MSEDQASVRPGMQVVRGVPDELELAALVAGLAAGEHAPSDDDGADLSGHWADRSRGLRGNPPATAWRWSLR